MEIPQEFSSSSSSLTDRYSFDIFLSYRGEDTRNGFTSHLDKALRNANIEAFLDNRVIEIGEDLTPELERAIKTSRASIIVFSKNYAYSRWCLNELVLILDQRKKSNHRIIPIYYHVDPSDIRKLQGSFGDAMEKHEERIDAEKNPEKKNQMGPKMERWKEALVEVANLKGHDVNGRLETEFIEEIIKDIHDRLGVLLRSEPPELIGVEDHIHFITSWLKDGSTHTADILTILGMGGIGKTSLAKYVYGFHSYLFQRSSFIENIYRKCPESCDKLLDLQNTLCSDISGKSSVQVRDVSVYTSMIEHALVRTEVLIVLDDVDSLDQLYALLGKTGFHQGSKIIITTKDASLTKKFKLNKSKVQPKHTMCLLKGLNDTSSLQLLTSHAFTCNSPKGGYEEVLEKLVKYCQGHPLALKIMGRSLCDLGIAEWEEQIDLLNKETNSRIVKVLRMSIDSLESQDKELFKHIACFFAGKDRLFAETIFKACGIRTLNGIKNLIDRCLLTVGRRNELKMHQLLQDVGRDIVRQESDKPWKRSRLWCHEESFNVLQQKRGKGRLKGVALDWKVLNEEKSNGSLELETDALSTMDGLVFLQLNYVQFKGSYEKFPKNLRWLCMHGFPSQSIPSDLPMGNLVVLDMSYSHIESFDMSYSRPMKKRKLTGSCSEDNLLLRSLKILNLSFCYQLRRLRGLFNLHALERLILAGCRSLIEICDNIGECDKLLVIDLSYCNMLEKLPESLFKLKKLEALSLDGCNLGEFPIDMKDMNLQEMLNVFRNRVDSQASSSVTVHAVPQDLKLFNLCLTLVSLSLRYNNLQTESFPMAFSSLSMLEKLTLDGNPVIFLPNCVRSLRRIELLSLEEGKMIKTIEYPPSVKRNLKFSRWDLLNKLKFDLDVPPLAIALAIYSVAHSSIEIKGIVRIQPIAQVKADILHRLCWNDLDFIKNLEVETWHDFRIKKRSRVQLFYEFGIFSTFYGGKAIPNGIENKSTGSSISFTMPSSAYKLRGLNFCYLQTSRDPHDGFNLLTVMVTNKTKNHTWIYKHYVHWVKVDEECLVWLSHWMFGMNEMENDDQVIITIPEVDVSAGISIRECGVSFVYDDEKREEDVLNYYKPWNHIIGRDLSAFRLTTGEYFLDNHRFFWWHIDCPVYRPFIENGACYEEEGVYFSALPRNKSDMGTIRSRWGKLYERRKKTQVA